MEKYIEGNKEAFENRDPSWGTDITIRWLLLMRIIRKHI